MAKKCSIIVCTVHSIQSAKALVADKSVESEPLFREMGLPYSNWHFLRLSLNLWVVIFRLLWLSGYSNNTESLQQGKYRSVNAANKLISLAKKHGSVMLVGHGFTNRFIAKVLLSLGWLGPKVPGYKCWGYGVYKC